MDLAAEIAQPHGTGAQIDRLNNDRFPRSSRYSSEWLLAGVSGAANPLWMTEWLSEALDLRPACEYSI